MSQRHFQSGPFHIITGWDRPLQHYFLRITNPSAEAIVEAQEAAGEEPSDEALDACVPFDSLALPGGGMSGSGMSGGGMSLDAVLGTCAAHGIAVPPTLADDLRADTAAPRGTNLLHDYGSVPAPDAG